MLNLLVSLFLIVFFLMLFSFFISQVLNDNSLADLVWAPTIMIITFYTFFTHGSFSSRQILVTLLVLLWGLRLFGHLLLRRQSKRKSFRYKYLHQKWGKMYNLKSFTYIFMFEGILTLLVSLPVIFTNYYYSEGLNWLDNLGLTIWSFGFVMETVSDLHLLIFKNRAEDGENVLTEGLWKYSRHPNYFGESLVWCGLFIISLSVTHGVYTLVSPVLVIFLLLYVSGVPLLEKRYQNNENYQKYSKKTSKFLPKPLKNKII